MYALIRSAGGAALFLLLTGYSDPNSPTSQVVTDRTTPAASGAVVLPVLVRDPALAEASTLNVCLNAGTAPKPLRVSSISCWTGQTHCTALVELIGGDRLYLSEFDALNPPVAVSGNEMCIEPHRPIAGTLGQHPPSE